MQINYDPKADALYIKLRNAKIQESDGLADGILVGYDAAGKPVGIEFLEAAKLFGGRRELQVEMSLTENLKK